MDPPVNLSYILEQLNEFDELAVKIEDVIENRLLFYKEMVQFSVYVKSSVVIRMIKQIQAADRAIRETIKQTF